MSIRLEDLEDEEPEQIGQPAPASQSIEVDGRKLTVEDIKEALRFKEKDYPEAVSAFGRSQTRLKEVERRAQDLEAELAALANVGTQAPAEVDYGRYYGQAGYQIPQPQYPQQMPPAEYAQAAAELEKVNRALKQIEQKYNSRLESIEGMLKQQENLAYIEQQFIALKEKHPDVDAPMVKRITDFLRDRHQQNLGWVDPELVYSHLRLEDAEELLKKEETKKRRKASAAEPGAGEPVSIREKPKTEEEWRADLERDIRENWSEMGGMGL